MEPPPTGVLAALLFDDFGVVLVFVPLLFDIGDRRRILMRLFTAGGNGCGLSTGDLDLLKLELANSSEVKQCLSRFRRRLLPA